MAGPPLSAPESIARARAALLREGFEVVADWKSGSRERPEPSAPTYGKGAQLILGERNVRADVTRNDRLGRRARLGFGALAASVVAFAILDAFYAADNWWVIPVSAVMSISLGVGILSLGAQDYWSEVVVVAALSGADNPPSGSADRQAGDHVAFEVSGAVVRGQNYSSKSGFGRTIKESFDRPETGEAVDAVADHLQDGERLRE